MAGRGVDGEPSGTHHTRRTAESAERPSSPEPFPPPSSAANAYSGQQDRRGLWVMPGLLGAPLASVRKWATTQPRCIRRARAWDDREKPHPPPRRSGLVSLSPSGPRGRDPAPKAAGVPRHHQLRSKRSAADKVEPPRGRHWWYPTGTTGDRERPRGSHSYAMRRRQPTTYVCTHCMCARGCMKTGRDRLGDPPSGQSWIGILG